MSHLASNRDHDLPGKRRRTRTRPADGRASVSANNETLRPDKGRDCSERGRANPAVKMDAPGSQILSSPDLFAPPRYHSPDRCHRCKQQQRAAHQQTERPDQININISMDQVLFMYRRQTRSNLGRNFQHQLCLKPARSLNKTLQSLSTEWWPARPLADCCPVPQIIPYSFTLARKIRFRNRIPTAGAWGVPC
jgi:hypothetical protein